MIQDCMIQDCNEAVKRFNWDTVMYVLVQKLPTMMSLLTQLTQLIQSPAEQKPMLCFMVSLLLKSGHQYMGLVEHACVMMYGNGTSKQVS